MAMDIFKVGLKYQVFDMGDNSPLGPTHKTRDDAWDWWFDHSEEEMAKPGYGLNTAQRAAAAAVLSAQGDVVGKTAKGSSGDGEGK